MNNLTFFQLSPKVLQALVKYPALKHCVEEFDRTNGNSDSATLSPLACYIKGLEEKCGFNCSYDFGWDAEIIKLDWDEEKITQDFGEDALGEIDGIISIDECCSILGVERGALDSYLNSIYTLADDFSNWGCNSRYVMVLEPELEMSLEYYLSMLLNWIAMQPNFEEPIYF